jgi:hypothetical protein
MAFENGVAFFTTGTVSIPFPEDDTVCHWCPLLENEYKMERARCRRTGEIIIAPNFMRGQFCPMKFNGEELIVE